MSSLPSSHWRRQSLPSYRNRESPVSPPSSKPFLSYVVPEYSPSLEASLPPDRRIDEGLNDEAVKELEVPTLDDSDDSDVTINDCQYIGSYNWTKKANPTIIVPGSPPEWLNRAMPYTVQPDMGFQYIDQNNYRIPSSNLLPLVVAVNKKHKDGGLDPFPWGTVDIVTDRNGLRKLLRWIGGGIVKEFRIDTQLAGTKTVLLNRWEKRTREQSSGRTYGFRFEKASTTPAAGCVESSGHHRIVTYDFSGIKMVVRYEVDACMPQTRKTRKSAPNLDGLAEAMKNMNLASTTAAPFSSSTMPALAIINGGNEIDQAATIEITTRAEFRRESFDWNEAYPQLFISQTSHHFMALHQRGRFVTLEKRKLSSPELEAVREEMQPTFKKLRKLLDVIQEIVIKHGSNGRLSLVCSDGRLSVYQRKSRTSCLPDEAMSCFELERL